MDSNVRRMQAIERSSRLAVLISSVAFFCFVEFFIIYSVIW